MKRSKKPANAKIKKQTGSKNLNRNIASYFITNKFLIPLLVLILLIIPVLNVVIQLKGFANNSKPQIIKEEKYWFKLLRKSNVEKLYLGKPGDENNSKIVKTFNVKTGVLGKRPTPLPSLLGREYWVIDDKFDAKDYPETAPYFLKLDVPVSEEYPYGPVPYEECSGPASQRGEQCDWELPGYFGLHGINGDSSRLSPENEGSSGCIRHSDEDITYLYNLIDPKDKVRYYVEDI